MSMHVGLLEEITALQYKREEEKPRAACVKLARLHLKGFVIQRHEEHFTHGTPDMSVAGNLRGSWWEFKYAIPSKSGKLEFKSKGIQDLTMSRLAKACGIAYYIIYSVDDLGVRRTHICEPKNLADWEASPLWANGFNHQFVVEFIYKVHTHDEP